MRRSNAEIEMTLSKLNAVEAKMRDVDTGVMRPDRVDTTSAIQMLRDFMMDDNIVGARAALTNQDMSSID